MTANRSALFYAAFAHVLACAQLRAQQADDPARGLSRADVAYALQDSVFGWIVYRSDGSAHSDSARRFAAAGAWDLEGGDWQRGVRLLQTAVRFGVADETFYRDAAELMKLLRCPAEAVTLLEEVRRRWPTATWADSVYKHAVQARERASPEHQRRVCPVRVRNPERAP